MRDRNRAAMRERGPIHVGLSEDGLTVEVCIASQTVFMAPSFADDLGGILMAVAEMARRRAGSDKNPSPSIPPSSPGDI